MPRPRKDAGAEVGPSLRVVWSIVIGGLVVPLDGNSGKEDFRSYGEGADQRASLFLDQLARLHICRQECQYLYLHRGKVSRK